MPLSWILNMPMDGLAVNIYSRASVIGFFKIEFIIFRILK